MRTIPKGKWSAMTREPRFGSDALRIQDPVDEITLLISDQGWLYWKDTETETWYRTHPDYGETT